MSNWIDAEAIIAGGDPDGTCHIYKVEDPGIAQPYDVTGFCCIGAGAPHAQSQFMVAEYRSGWPFANALNLAYLSKVRSQGTSGVGVKTDVFTINKDGGWQSTPEDVAKFAEIHARREVRYRAADDTADSELFHYLFAKWSVVTPPSATEAPPRLGTSITTDNPPSVSVEKDAADKSAN